MPEFENPTRRYKSFRPRQAARGHASMTSLTNFATISLLNDSNGNQLIVVRDWYIGQLMQGAVDVFFRRGAIGTPVSGATTPIVSGAQLPGQMFTSDEASALNTLIIDESGLTQNFLKAGMPFWVLQPGEALIFQNDTAQKDTDIFVLWEAIFPDELDFMW